MSTFQGSKSALESLRSTVSPVTHGSSNALPSSKFFCLIVAFCGPFVLSEAHFGHGFLPFRTKFFPVALTVPSVTLVCFLFNPHNPLNYESRKAAIKTRLASKAAAAAACTSNGTPSTNDDKENQAPPSVLGKRSAAVPLGCAQRKKPPPAPSINEEEPPTTNQNE